ncbi:hypothetical protein VPHK469_0128 [Vibrio phage K469]
MGRLTNIQKEYPMVNKKVADQKGGCYPARFPNGQMKSVFMSDSLVAKIVEATKKPTPIHQRGSRADLIICDEV